MYNQNNEKSSANTVLIICVSVLSVMLIVILVIGILFFSGVISVSSGEPESVQTGYMAGEANTAAEHGEVQNIENTTVSGYRYVSNVRDSIYLRSEPVESSDANIICTIPLGTQVGFIEISNDVFSKINYNGTIGYSKTQYLSTEYTASNTTVVGYRYVVNVENSIYIRSTPSEANNSNILGTIPLGTQVGFIEQTNSTFSKIAYNGMVGYAKNIYLSSSYSNSYSYGTTMTVCNVKTSIYLRNAPREESGNIICEIPVNSAVTLVERTNNVFYKIRWNGKTGYAKAEYLR